MCGLHYISHCVFGQCWLRGLVLRDLAQRLPLSGSFLTTSAEGDVSHRHSFSKTIDMSHIIIIFL